jgi:hypothetical protein
MPSRIGIRGYIGVKCMTSSISRGRVKLKDEEASTDAPVILRLTLSPELNMMFVKGCCSSTVAAT